MSSLGRTEFEADELPQTAEGSAGREAQWLRLARDGDRAAYGRIVELYRDRLYNAVLRLVGDHDEARDLTQEAFTRGLMKIESYRGDAAPYTWLFRIAINLAISSLRKTRRHRTFSLDASSSNGHAQREDDQATPLVERLASTQADGPDEAAEKREQNEAVLAALGRLDAEYRAVLVMRDIEGFDYQQMADVLGLPLGTLKSRLFRARLALRDELKGYFGERR